MNKSSRISRWQLGTIGAVCCIVGIRILLNIGSPSSLQEDKVPSQSLPQLQELLEDFPPLEDQMSPTLPPDIGNLFDPPTQPSSL